MQEPVEHSRRRPQYTLQGISVLVVAAMVCVSMRPLAAAAKTAEAQRALVQRIPATWRAVETLRRESVAVQPPVDTVEEQYGQVLAELKEFLRAPKGNLQAVRAKAKQLEALEPAVEGGFTSVSRMLDEKRLPDELKSRHKAAEQQFKLQQKEFKRLLKQVETADDAKDLAAGARSLKALEAFLGKQRQEAPHRKLEPKKLPWRVPKATARKPARSLKAFPKWSPSTVAAPDTARAMVSTTPELAETDDAQLTPAVRDLATSLGHNPVSIYNWVRNNIVYVPSFGSIQGSDSTLGKKQGNAFDTASLLVALYRASGIPARYVYGTIRVPANQAMNWVGGVTRPEAAQQLWGQGGVPNIAVISGGRITHIELEHVWVEARVDFVPSRGQVQREGDTWVPLDASFKQSSEQASLVVSANIPVDVGALHSAFLSGASVNEAEGWVQGPNIAAALSAAEQYKSDLVSFTQVVKPQATFEEIFGARTIIEEAHTALAGTLPYETVAVGARYTDLPPGLTQQFRFAIYASELDQAEGSPMLSFVENLPQLAGRQVMLGYAPASQADAELLVSLLPKRAADGSPPTVDAYLGLRFPAYLLRLKPELRVDGVVRATGEAVTMGTELSTVGAFKELDLSSGWDETSDSLIAGQVTAIGLDLQGIDMRQVSRISERLAETKARLETGQTIDPLTTTVTRDILTLPLWRYFASLHPSGSATRALARMVDLPALSYGLAHLDLEVAYAFGIPRSAKLSAPVLDIGHLRSIRWSKDGDKAAWVRYNTLTGIQASALEHLMLESVFVGRDPSVEGISAVRLIAKAAAMGQRVYTITRENLAAVLPQLLLSAETVEHISSAVSAGQEVTVHEKPVELQGWVGAGYIALDPETGAGAYLIEGGANGATLGGKIASYLLGVVYGGLMGLLAIYMLHAIVGVVASGAAVTLAAALPALLPFLFLIAFALILYWMAQELHDDLGPELYQCFTGGFTMGWGVMSIGFPPMRPVLMVILTLAGGGVAGSSIPQCLFGLDAI